MNSNSEISISSTNNKDSSNTLSDESIKSKTMPITYLSIGFYDITTIGI